MKTIFFIIVIIVGFVTLPTKASTYICQSDDRAVFSSDRINSSCRLSQMNGSSDEQHVAAAKLANSSTEADRTGQIWEAEQNDIKIAPSSRDTTVTNTAEAASPSLQVKIRNANKAKKQAPRKPIIVPHITTAPAKQQLSRNQILQNEIRNEQTALVRTKAQLNVAKKKGDKAKTSRLEQEVRDREASIRAIQAEMKR
ncbi:hypothetical protein H3L92_10035 [Neisseria dentiae]|nr:hypothetical protein H3L92_10035 [Neisseria dentiae]